MNQNITLNAKNKVKLSHAGMPKVQITTLAMPLIIPSTPFSKKLLLSYVVELVENSSEIKGIAKPKIKKNNAIIKIHS
jgi:hypothetical protein